METNVIKTSKHAQSVEITIILLHCQLSVKMAKFVVAGKSGCPFFARAELLADELELKLPNFNIHKIILNPSEWDKWVSATCTEKGWTYSGKSPIIWRELINRGGKGTLLGSCNEFLEYAKGYYGITSDKSSQDLLSIAKENEETLEANYEEERQRKEAIKPFQISVIGSESPLAYHVLPLIIKEDIFEKTQELSISLHYDISSDKNEKSAEVRTLIDGLVMEIQDCAQSELRYVFSTTDLKLCEKSNIIILLSLTKEFDKEFVSYLKNIAVKLKKVINEETKIVFVGEHPIICCNIIHYFLNGIPRKNLMAMTRYEENLGKAAISRILEINTAGIQNLILWGSSKEFIVDYSCAKAYAYNGAIWAPHIETFSHSIKEIVYDKKFLDKDLPQMVNNKERSLNTKLLSLSAAFITQLKDLLSNSSPKTSTNNNIYSLGVISDGSYGVPEGLVYSFPVQYSEIGINIVGDIECSETMKENIKRNAQELQDYCNELIAFVDSSILKKKAKPIDPNASKDYLDVITNEDEPDEEETKTT